MQLPKSVQDKVLEQAKVDREKERIRIKMEQTGMSAASAVSYVTMNSVDKVVKNAKIEKMKYLS